MTRSPHLDTIAIHGRDDETFPYAAVVEPIILSTTFAQPEPARPLRYEYARSGNPTRELLEKRLAALEDGRHGLAFASGSGATLTLLHTLRPGDHVLTGDDVYGGTFRLFDKICRPLGIESSAVDARGVDAFAAGLRATTRLVWVETPTNPLLKLFDIGALAELCRGRGIALVVDNTFASPMLQRPLQLGATVVMHSTTKYVNGHSDVVGGALITSDEALAERLRFLQNALGAVPGPFDCYLTLRGIKTLPVRMRQHVTSATELATRLERAPGVARVHYPGLPSHPDHELAKRQMRGGGGMISVELEGGAERARRFLTRLEIFTLAESLGAVESLAEHPASMTHASIPAEQRQRVGISDGLVRLSVGLEDVSDLWGDLEQALSDGV
jgi:cystathionine gamma-synthase/cystathionine gamma-lyase